MAREGKTEGRAAQDGAEPPLLGLLKPDEAASVLRRLLEVHSDLSSEAEEIARSLLHQVDYQEVAADGRLIFHWLGSSSASRLWG